MKFKINVEQFFKAFKPVADVALKNIKKLKNGKDFGYAGFVTLEAFADALQLKAYGGAAIDKIERKTK